MPSWRDFIRWDLRFFAPEQIRPDLVADLRFFMLSNSVTSIREQISSTHWGNVAFFTVIIEECFPSLLSLVLSLWPPKVPPPSPSNQAGECCMVRVYWIGWLLVTNKAIMHRDPDFGISISTAKHTRVYERPKLWTLVFATKRYYNYGFS